MSKPVTDRGHTIKAVDFASLESIRQFVYLRDKCAGISISKALVSSVLDFLQLSSIPHV